MESTDSKEHQEREPKGREIVLHFIRHGEAEYPTEELYYEGKLTPTGQDQARNAAHQLYNELEEGAIVTFNSSPRRRAVETAKIIQEELTKLESVKPKGLIIRSRSPQLTKDINVDDQSTAEYIELQEQGLEPSQVWLENPGQATQEIEKNFGNLLRRMRHLSEKIRNDGPNVHRIFITHTGPSEVFVGRLIDQTSLGTLANCEEFKIHLPVSGQPPIMEFKDIRQEISV